jgi:hypothetical protein
MVTKQRLIAIGQPSHATHDTENVVIGSIDTNLGSLGALNGSVGENKLKSSIVNAGEVARSAWLVLFGPQGKRVHIDTGVRSASVVLVRLDEVEVSTLTLREAILAVKLELSGDNRVLTPAVKRERSLSENESTGIGDTRVIVGEITTASKPRSHVALFVAIVVLIRLLTLTPPVSAGNIESASLVEETGAINERASTRGNRIVATEGVDSIGKSIDSISVVEGLSTKNTVEKLVTLERRTVVNVLIRLDNPNELLNGVVKVELDFVGRRADGLITSELELLNKVLMGILGHTSALIGVQEDVVDIERGSNQRLIVGVVDATTDGRVGSIVVAVKRTNGPQALIDGADIKVNLDLVILKGDEGKGKTGIAAVPELEGDIEGSLGESIAGGANLTRSVSLARTIDGIERRIGDEGKLGGVSDHSIVTGLLVNGESQIVPDVHPVTILTVNALTTDFNLNLRNQLLTGEVEPTGINTVLGSSLHGLVNLGESNLKVSAVSQITITRDGAGHAATKVGLAVKSLLNRLHRKVSVTFVRHLPKGNLRVARKINILGTVSYKLHKTSCHFRLL